ncbi:MAG: cytochrome C oxidase subunit IV family protein [Pirellulaceae bacterium]|nr:cytochrome C oxidase subunit IV family protein [Pirellulaceae bacterium]
MAGHHDDHSFAHPAPLKLLFAVFFALIALTILTVALATVDLGPFGIWISMTIATVKAALVALFFMHMYWDKSFNVLVFLSSFLFVALFIGLTMTDTQHYQEQIDAFPRKAEGDAN